MKVTHIQLKEALFVPGVTQLPVTINPEHCAGIDMEMHHAGVFCRYRGKAFVIPFNACRAIVVEEKQDAKPSSKKA